MNWEEDTMLRNDVPVKAKKKRRLPYLLIALSLMFLLLLIPQSANAAAFSKKAKPKFVITNCKYSQGNVTLQWKKLKGAKKYIIYRASKKKGKYKKFATTKKLSITKKSPGEFYYKVQAVKGKTKSKQSAAVHVFSGFGNIYQSFRTNVGGFYYRTIYYAAFKNETKKAMTITEGASCTFYQYDPATGNLLELQTGEVVMGATMEPGKDASFSVRAGAPTVQSGTVLVIKVPFQAGGQQYDLFIGREPVNTWVPAITK